MRDERVQAYFHALDLRIHEAWSLFKLIDKDCANVISIADFVDGCLRMRGNAKSIEINEMMYQNKFMMDLITDVLEEMERLNPELAYPVAQREISGGRKGRSVISQGSSHPASEAGRMGDNDPHSPRSWTLQARRAARMHRSPRSHSHRSEGSSEPADGTPTQSPTNASARNSKADKVDFGIADNVAI
eukprot:TRINITY_DN31529_c0_g2_i4.p1 TRINITY_DN31529_c0_g2~~TRINITY_DN31529_c0_g2_i4.p1  ORF type:complete len:188 (-),score=33.06 TRINITY_DN31529_c0_g2_i4:465-1028(-)